MSKLAELSIIFATTCNILGLFIVWFFFPNDFPKSEVEWTDFVAIFLVNPSMGLNLKVQNKGLMGADMQY